MHSLFRNFIACLCGQFGKALVSLIAVPLYLPLLGAEAFGLVGFHGSLMAVLALIDGGLGVAASREVARRQGTNQNAETTRSFVWTLECIYWIVGALMAIVLVLLSGWLASNWLTPKELTTDTAAACLALLGISVALRWPASLYLGVLAGYQRLVITNTVALIGGIGYGFGGYLVLLYVDSSPLAFFQWALMLNVFEVAALAYYTRQALPSAVGRVSFRLSELKSIAKFALGNGVLAVVTVGLTNSDRLILSKLVTLDKLGFYSIATQINGLISRLGGIFYGLYLPRFSQLVAANDEKSTLQEFAKAVQLSSILVFPAYALSIILMPDLLLWWLGNSAIASGVTLPAQWLIVGGAFNSLILIPHTLLLAFGITSFAIKQNMVALVLYLPVLFWLVSRFGITGAAISWAILNTGYFLISPPIMLNLVFRRVPRYFFYKCCWLPITLAACNLLVARLLLNEGTAVRISVAVLISGLSLICQVSLVPWLFLNIKSFWARRPGFQ